MLKLIYWPFLPGRGEFVRLVLEDAGADYDDVARRPESDGGGPAAVRALLYGAGERMPGFAPPFLIDGDITLAQMAAVCSYLAPKLGLAPDGEAPRARALQLQLTIADAVGEVHDVHHPVSSALTYEEQSEEAARAAAAFRDIRLPRWLGFFDKVVADGGGPFVFGAAASYVDLGVFQLVEGLRYAFPRAAAGALEAVPRIVELRDRVAERPNIAGYLQSERRMAFNEHGIFRRYPELDAPA